jgi:alpha-tubulin suppressor-like RCC1 family protein
MTVGVNDLEQCVNAAITTASTPLSILQLSSVSRDFDVGFVKSVACVASLPAAADNKGRMIYVEDVCGYRISDGTAWINDFTSTLTSSSTAYAWGCNSTNGRLGDNSTINRSSPVSVVGGFTEWCQVSAGGSHSLGVRTNGTAWGWGLNSGGQLGDNNASAAWQSSPVSVVGGFTDWCQIATGDSHSLGVRINGTAWAWGCNANGQLGDDSTINRSSPVSVIGGFTNWCQISAGDGNHSLGLRTNGTVWAWGYNYRGQLGDNTNIDRSSPVSVIGGFTDWCQISAGQAHNLGLRTNGTVWAWGHNYRGQLGDDSTINRSSPISICGGFTDWCQLSAGLHSLGVRTNGTTWAWGCGGQGQLGDNTNIDRSSPVSVVGGFTDWCQVSASWYHSLGVRTNGIAWAWGCGGQGRLGNNCTTNRSSPVSVVGGFTNWCQVSAGYSHSLGIAGEPPRGFA